MCKNVPRLQTVGLFHFLILQNGKRYECEASEGSYIHSEAFTLERRI